MTGLEQVSFARSGIVFDCPVPVTAEGRTLRPDGEPIPIADRPHACGAPAPYLIGAQLVCEAHLRQACAFLSIDADDVIRELRGE